MEYSLRAILYLIELQANESKKSWHYYYTEEYPFLDISAFKAEVSDYLIQYGFERLRTFLNESVRLCMKILHVSDSLSNIPIANNSCIYCTFEKKESPSFYDAGLYNINLIRQAKPNAKRIEIWNIIEAVKTIANFLTEVGISDIKPNHPTIINQLTNNVSASAQVIFNETMSKEAKQVTADTATPVEVTTELTPQPENQESQKADDKPIKPFLEYFPEDKREPLLKKLTTLLNGQTGQAVAIIIMALEDKYHFRIPSKGMTGFIKLMQDQFGYIGSRVGITNFYRKFSKSPKGVDIPLISQAEIQSIINQLP